MWAKFVVAFFFRTPLDCFEVLLCLWASFFRTSNIHTPFRLFICVKLIISGGSQWGSGFYG